MCIQLLGVVVLYERLCVEFVVYVGLLDMFELGVVGMWRCGRRSVVVESAEKERDYKGVLGELYVMFFFGHGVKGCKRRNGRACFDEYY